jgi:hypothetical protein
VEITAADRPALELALATYRRRSSVNWRQVAAKLADDGWDETARFCAYAEQCTSLRLKPWQWPPVWIKDIEEALAVPPPDLSGFRAAAELLQRMLAAGVSKFHPDPMQALASIEQAAAQARHGTSDRAMGARRSQRECARRGYTVPNKSRPSPL